MALKEGSIDQELTKENISVDVPASSQMIECFSQQGYDYTDQWGILMRGNVIV